MSGRKLGGGRILGSGKGLGPPVPPPPASTAAAAAAHHARAQAGAASADLDAARSRSPFAPSESSVSMGSSMPSPSGSAGLPDFSQDLTANISLGRPIKGSGAADKGLTCPICSEEMVTLLQLNRHIDDEHQELPEVEQDEVKTWFDKQVLRAKRFQPLSLINQKLRGIETFESNESMPVPAPGPSASSSSTTNGRIPDIPIDPDELITRSHWQRSTSDDVCTDPACGRGLGPLNGSINCRSCGRLFCEVHTMYQMKLSRSAVHEPVRGYWARVCETCYKSRPGYNDHVGKAVDHTRAFVAMRTKRVERQNLEIARLEKRLTKITHLLANPPAETPQTNGTLLSPVANLTGQKSQRKLLEQSVVTWEEDASVAKCPFCQQEFGSWTFRRHHCRICGRVVCADPQTGCSSEIGLNVASRTGPSTTEKPSTPSGAAGGNGGGGGPSPGQVSIDIRMCQDCSHTIFAKRDFEASLAAKPPDQRAYETLRAFQSGIQQLMPSFQRTLLNLQGGGGGGGGVAGDDGSSKPPPTHAQIQEAAKIRKRLIDSFTKYDLAARRLRDMTTKSEAQLQLQKNVYAAASQFLHLNMLPLKSVPHMLRRGTSTSARLLHSSSAGSSANASTSSLGLHPSQQQQQHLSPLRNGQVASPVRTAAGAGASLEPQHQNLETSSQAGSEASTVASALETEEKSLRERLVVLEEQRFLVRQMVDNARSARRFEEVGVLSQNAGELDKEIERLRKKVGNVEERWQGLYASADVS